MAFVGAQVATVLVLGVAQLAGNSSADRLVLAGVAVSFVIMACANILIFLGDPRSTHTVEFWMLGGLGLAQWSHLLWPLAVLIPCGIWLWAQAGRLNAMSLGEETAASLGIEVGRFRLTVFVAAALITGVMVAFSGLIGFVGLMMPHLVRLVVGGDAARVLPGSALTGAVFLIWADEIARIVLAPEDIPIGVVTGLIGGVFFIWMMARRQ
ncbi:iron ABC transporter permease, partial [Pseudotabrizicola sp.]|uniref:FecCD family ABC transporter permease n=1 Tax=Pseudotabrizicola sp. TaxID=2939647 RepID=UPI00271893E5